MPAPPSPSLHALAPRTAVLTLQYCPMRTIASRRAKSGRRLGAKVRTSAAAADVDAAVAAVVDVA
jgi:hypothetical protein